MKSNVTIKKVDINQVVNTMIELWNNGVDYVDIELNPKENIIVLSYIEEYLSDDFEYDDDDDVLEIENEEEVRTFKKNIKIEKTLTEEDLEELM